MEDIKLIAKKRTGQGSSEVRRMRSAGILPGVIYSGGGDAVSIQLDMHAFEQLLHHHTSESLIAEVELDGKPIPVLVKDVQHQPVTSDLLHVDLQQVNMSEVIQVEIELDLVGESAGVKAGGVMEQVVHAVEIECLPGDLVESLSVDVSALEIGDTLTAADIKLSDKFTLLSDPEMVVISIGGPRSEEEEEVNGDEATEPEVLTEKKEEA